MKNAFIPFANPGAAFQARKHEYDEAFSRVIGSGQYILGPEVETFERRFAEWLADASCAAGDCIGVANGTDAIEIALRALQGLFPVPPDTLPAVFTVSHTAVATVAAIERAGCVPVLVDIDEASYTMSPGSLEAAVNMVAAERPDLAPMAVIPVHLYGHPCDLDAIMGIGERHGMRIIEDCAQAHGAAYRGRRVGTLGIAGTFSFYPTKNLGAIGDAGAVYTGDSALAAEMRALRQYGWKQRYVSAVPGINSRMDPLQAAFLDINLRHLDADNAARRAIAARYDALISRATITPPVAKPEVEHAFHLYVLRSKRLGRPRSISARAGSGHRRALPPSGAFPTRIRRACHHRTRRPAHHGACGPRASQPAHVPATYSGGRGTRCTRPSGLGQGAVVMSFANANVLITGGAGFIGSNLAIRLIGAGANVTIVDSLIPEYGGNLRNLAPVHGLCHLNISDAATPTPCATSSNPRTICSTSPGRPATWIP
jgi:dTDP-4-amino-4,6-dideoxygalactose transaminase